MASGLIRPEIDSPTRQSCPKAIGCKEAARLREQIAQLSGQLAAAEHRLERPEITRETVLKLATPGPHVHMSKRP
ncbi:hypothetical protein ACWDRR_23410 [Kitasatospora sp. NPDC003701]